MTEVLCDCILIHFKESEVMTAGQLITEVLSWHEAQNESFMPTSVARENVGVYGFKADWGSADSL